MYSRLGKLAQILLCKLLACPPVIFAGAWVPTPNAALCTGSCDNLLEAQKSASLLQIGHRSGAFSLEREHRISYNDTSYNGTAMEEDRSEAAPVDLEQLGLHRVVGKDGVLMITLPRHADRFNYSVSMLSQAGIYPTMFPGVDGKDPNTSQADLASACSGCPTRALQALALSHRRALLAAQQRDSDWTAILENDVVPVLGTKVGITHSNWNDAFDAAWALLPPEARFVRLGRCVSKSWQGSQTPSKAGVELRTYADGGAFRVVKWTGQNGDYSAGGCNHAYVVHKSVLPEVLALFPCSSVLDHCFQSRLFNNMTQMGNRGFYSLFNIDTHTTPDEAWTEANARGSYENVMQFGILQQDWHAMPMGSTKEAQTNHSDKLKNGKGSQLLGFDSSGNGSSSPIELVLSDSAERGAMSEGGVAINATSGEELNNITVDIALESE